MTVPAGDRARVSVLVRVPPEAAFRIFSEEIEQWWRRGRRFRASQGIVHLEPRVGGRLFEAIETSVGQSARSAAAANTTGERIVQTGRVTVWEPPARLAFEWRAVNFAPHEWTLVEVSFEPSPSGTLVTVTHQGWSKIRPDHPARHGLEVPAFIRMMALWWGDLLTSLREHITSGP